MKVTKEDLDRWCNCFNFPYQKCKDCKSILGNLTHLEEGEIYNTEL